jgi:uncharacterized phage protein (TIGR01671 family)
MREIKFRAWDGHKMNDKISIIRGVAIKEGYAATAWHSSALAGEIMQFTGRQDRTGIDIFQSDIIRDHIGIGVVKYVDDKAAFRVSYGDGLAKWFIDYTLRGERGSIEVIGNIHESPELLELAA